LDYGEARNYLTITQQFGSRLGLDRMNRLMELLGNPGENIDYFHIAGTNGKGSVTMMTANSLAAGGHRVGVYTSPFVERFEERIRIIDGKAGLLRFSGDETHGEISGEDFAMHFTRIKTCVDQMLESGMEHPTEFELITALAFLHFDQMKCDTVVMETGLGGRLDSTNWVAHPRKCMITAIGYDHMDRLGDTIEAITSEKAGIIKSGAEVVLYDPNDYTSASEARIILSIIRGQCDAKKAKSLTIVSSDRICMQSYTVEGQVFSYLGNRIEMSLLGIYQPMNAAVAIESCRDFVDMESIQTGIRLTRWPARMERIKKEHPPAFLDGGHNLQGAAALRDTLDQLQAGRKIVFLCGVMRDKEYEKMLTVLLSSDQYRVEAVFCTKPNNPRALSASILAKSISEILDNLPQSSYNRFATVIFDDKVSFMTDRAFESAIKKDATFVAFGSLYMAGEIREKVRRDWN